MSWNAKPSGGYNIDSNEAIENMNEFKNCLISSWSEYAIAGALGNIANESAFNPWRWQSDIVNYSAGYGLVQFTPASGYINNYTNHANLSTTSTTSGADPDDGYYQCLVLENDSMGKWINRSSYNTWYDISAYANFSSFKTVNNLYDATMAFLYNYEGNYIVIHGSEVEQRADFELRYNSALTCYNYIHGSGPGPAPTGSRKKDSILKHLFKYRLIY